MKLKYSIVDAASDAFKNIAHFFGVSTMRTLGIALFVACLFFVVKYARTQYVKTAETLDPIAIRGVVIGSAKGAASEGFSDIALRKIEQKYSTRLESGVERCFSVYPTLQYGDGPKIDSFIESALKDDVLFNKERMRSGRALEKEDEIVLTGQLAARLKIDEDDVQNGGALVCAVQTRTRDGKAEENVLKLTVVGICRGADEKAYVLENLAARMNAWAGGANVFDVGDAPIRSAFVYLNENRREDVKNYAHDNGLDIQWLEKPLIIPELSAPTWAEVDLQSTSVSDKEIQIHYVQYYLYKNDLFVILDREDPRFNFRELPVEEESRYVNLENALTKDEPGSSPSASTEDKAVPNSNILMKDKPTPTSRALTKDKPVPNPNALTKDEPVPNPNALTKDKTVPNSNALTKDEPVPNPNALTKDEPVPNSNALTKDKTVPSPSALTKDEPGLNPNASTIGTLETSSDVPQKTTRLGSDSSLARQGMERTTKNGATPMWWKELTIKSGSDLANAFGRNFRDLDVRIVAVDECPEVNLDGQSLRDRLTNSGKPMIAYAHLTKEDNQFYRKAFLDNAIKTFTPQVTDELVIGMISCPNEEKAPENFLANLKAIGARSVKEKLEIAGQLDGVDLRFFGGQENDPENRLLEPIENNKLPIVALCQRDAEALNAIHWKTGDPVKLNFSRFTGEAYGLYETIELSFAFGGVSRFTKLPMNEIKQLALWQNHELEYDANEKRFVDRAMERAMQQAFRARVIAKTPADALALVDAFQRDGYKILSSGVDQIEQTRQLFYGLVAFCLIVIGVLLIFCLNAIISSDFLTFQLKMNDARVMLEMGMTRTQVFKEIIVESALLASLAMGLASIVLYLINMLIQYFKPAVGSAFEDLHLFDREGMVILAITAIVALALSLIAEIITIINLARCKRPRRAN